MHIVEADSFVEAGRGNIDLLVDLQVLVENVLGNEDIMMGFLAVILHLLFLNLTLDLLSSLLLFLELDLLGKQALLHFSLHSFFHGRWFSLGIGTLLEESSQFVL